MTRRARLAPGVVGCVLALLLTGLAGQAGPAGLSASPAAAEPVTGRSSAFAAPPRVARVEMLLTKSATRRILAGDNRVEGRGGATTRLARKQLHFVFRYRRAGQPRGVKVLVGRIAFVGAGQEVRWRQLQVNFGTRRITGLGIRDRRIPLLQLISLHGAGSGSGFDADTALILTDRGADMLNRANDRDSDGEVPFASGDLVATAEGLS